MGVASQKLTSTGIVVGTQDYMSPEQLSGDAVDFRTDIYSLGIILFRMLTGQHPFVGSTTHESFKARLTGKPFTLAQARPDMSWPQPLQTVLDIALQPSPDQRYQLAADLGSDLVNAILDWLPDDESSPEPWNQRLRYQTPVRVRASREF
jgi:serine/threonine-protein kinase